MFEYIIIVTCHICYSYSIYVVTDGPVDLVFINKLLNYYLKLLLKIWRRTDKQAKAIFKHLSFFSALCFQNIYCKINFTSKIGLTFEISIVHWSFFCLFANIFACLQGY